MKFKFIEKVVPPVQNQKIIKDKDREKKDVKTVAKTATLSAGSDSLQDSRVTNPISLYSLTQVLESNIFLSENVVTASSVGAASNSGENSQTVNGEKKESETTKATVPTTTETTEKKIEIKRRELKPVTKPINFEFEVSPDQINWTKSGELSVSPTFMTNIQPVIYSRATAPVLTMSGILFDSIHVPNKSDLLSEVNQLERLLSVDAENFSPRVYDVFAESRKYGTYVLSSLKISETRRSTEGKPTRILADLVLQPVPDYQIRTSQDLAMPAEILPEIKVATTTGAAGSQTSVASAGGCLVAKGTVIAYTGDTGVDAGANHVHLEVEENGTRVDPISYAGNFKLGDRLLPEFINPDASDRFMGNRGNGRIHKGVDYGWGVTRGMPISVNVDGLSLTLVSSQYGEGGKGWGEYWEGKIGTTLYRFAHNSKINKDLFACTPASTTSVNSGNKGGNVDPNSVKTEAKT